MAAQPTREPVFDRPRLRRRLWLSVFLLILGLLAIAFALVPQPWRDMVAAVLGVALGWLASLGALVLALALGVGLLLAATLLLIVPRRERLQTIASATSDVGTMAITPGWNRPPSSTLVQVNGIAPVSVYLDIENGQVSPPEVRALIDQVHGVAGEQPVDLLFFGNAEPEAKTERYKELWRHGFQPVDVPYKQLGKGTATNIADLGLALHTFERALFGPPHQTIIIISHDQGFLPLVYRLQSLGHKVILWARDVQDSYKDAAKYLKGVTWMDLDLPPVPTMRAQAARDTHRAPAVATKAAKTAKAAPPPLPSFVALPSAPITISTVRLVMERTAELVRALQGMPKARRTLGDTLGGDEERSLDRIGYARFSKASSRVECWLEHLGALGVLADVIEGEMPTPGRTSPDAGTALFEQWLREVVDAAEQVARNTNGAVNLSDVCALLTGNDAPGAALALASLRTMLGLKDKVGERHVRYFCQCARALGMLDFTDTENPYIIRVVPRAAGGTMPDAPETAPPDGPTAPAV